MKRALIIEPTHFHGHVIYPQCIMLLEKGYEITLVISSEQWERELVYTLKDRVTIIEIDARSKKRFLFKFWVWNLSQQYDFVVFNTLQGRSDYLYAVVFPHRHIRYILHNLIPPSKRPRFTAFLESLARRRCDHIYVLSDQVMRVGRDLLPEWVARKLTFFHPVFFWGFYDPRGADGPVPEVDRIIFAVPGALDATRRNYGGLMGAFEKIAGSSIKHHIRILLMGDFMQPIGRKLVIEAAKCGLLGTVVELQVEKFEPFTSYAARLADSHFVLPLIDRTVLDVRGYNQLTVPSSLMLSRAFAVPLLASSDFALDDDLKPFAVIYPEDHLYAGLVAAVELCLSPEYQAIRQRYRQHTAGLFGASLANYVGR